MIEALILTVALSHPSLSPHVHRGDPRSAPRASSGPNLTYSQAEAIRQQKLDEREARRLKIIEEVNNRKAIIRLRRVARDNPFGYVFLPQFGFGWGLMSGEVRYGY